MPDPDRLLFYPIWVSTRHGHGQTTGWEWGNPCNLPPEARDIVRAKIEAGEAVWGTVVRSQGGKKTILLGYTKPYSVVRILKHYLELEDALGPEYDGTEG